jgi:hypothetical protein
MDYGGPLYIGGIGDGLVDNGSWGMRAAAFILLMVAGMSNLYGQQEQSSDSAKWEISTDINFYFIPDDFFIDPVVMADHGKLHLEGRYNWEDRNTFSAWIGKNYFGGKKIEYKITPMAGIVMGQTQGVAPGLEFSLAWKKFELSNSMEYLFDTNVKEESYFYSWNDLTYSIKDWLWMGLSTQRTRVYKTKLDLQKGLIIGLGYKKFDLTTYLYNIGFDTAFTVVTLSAGF